MYLIILNFFYYNYGSSSVGYFFSIRNNNLLFKNVNYNIIFDKKPNKNNLFKVFDNYWFMFRNNLNYFFKLF
jgi:hypothetical protein